MQLADNDNVIDYVLNDTPDDIHLWLIDEYLLTLHL